jgi:NADPH-dependent 2,4-dienoyl-CoA reductase/sulfur reductase-like enzyme
MTLNRRDLLISGGAAAAVGGVAVVSPVSAQAPQVPGKWDRETDVVVIGAGATGFTAAIVAREAGL